MKIAHVKKTQSCEISFLLPPKEDNSVCPVTDFGENLSCIQGLLFLGKKVCPTQLTVCSSELWKTKDKIYTIGDEHCLHRLLCLRRAWYYYSTTGWNFELWTLRGQMWTFSCIFWMSFFPFRWNVYLLKFKAALRPEYALFHQTYDILRFIFH